MYSPAAPLSRAWPLRRILVAALLVFSLLPALLVGGVMYASNLRAVDALASEELKDVADRVQAETLTHLLQAHTILNGIVPQYADAYQSAHAAALIDDPLEFERAAFSLARMHPNVTDLYFGNQQGAFVGVTPASTNPHTRTRVAIQFPHEQSRSYYSAGFPGDRSAAAPAETKPFDARVRPWYKMAVTAKDRLFSSIYPSRASVNQLVMTLAQPVYGPDGVGAGALGVVAIDLYLQRLTEFLQAQKVGLHGSAYLVDEEGFVVASSSGSPLFTLEGGVMVRQKPEQNTSEMVRAAHLAVQPMLGQSQAGSFARASFYGRTQLGGESLMVVMRPFGEYVGLRWNLVVTAPASDFNAAMAAALRTTLLIMLSVLGAGGLLAAYLAHRLSSYFERLGVAAAELGRGEVPQAQANARIREVRELSLVLRSSAQEIARNQRDIQAHTDALQDANENLELRVEQRTAELSASREEALSAVRAKAAFLATMSHEIRTPLNGVVGMSTLLAETPLDVEQRDFLDTIRLSSDQLLSVINDILDFSKIESGKLELEAEPLGLRTVVEESCDIAAPRAREKGLELIIDIAPPEPVDVPGGLPEAILGDVTRVRQVLINLINNAVKFTEKGEVALHVRRLPDRPAGVHGAQGKVVLEFRVTDTGIGIPPARLSQLFQAFAQVDTSTTRKYGGTGLGLVICKRLVELMGGEIGVESELGVGSTFWFTVLATPADLPAGLGVADPTSLHGKRVLIVDDHPTNLRVLHRQLALWGMEVLSAESAALALALLENSPSPFNAIVTDMHMPEMDGVELTRTLKANVRFAATPVILLSSGYMPPSDASAALFAARLLKPARQTQLFDALSRCLSPAGITAEKAPAAAPGVKKNITVLVADDNAVNLKVASAMLKRLGYDCCAVSDGRQAADAVTASLADGDRGFGAVLMDLNMPELDGLAATALIHSVWGERSPPIIALTAAASLEDKERCEAAGMDDYLTKPLQVAVLASALERWCQPKPAAINSIAATASNHWAASTFHSKNVPKNESVFMDFERLSEFKEFDDEALSMTREVLNLFTHDAPLRLDAIERAIAAGDAAALSLACHALAGSAGNIGAVALRSVSVALEIESKSGAVPANAGVELAKLRAYWERTHELLLAWDDRLI